MIKVFVSGCFDVLHAGHVEFFRQAKALGDYLVVDFATDEVLYRYKHRRSSLPEEHKKMILESLKYIDKVTLGGGPNDGLNFEHNFLTEKPDILAVTEDDQFEAEKRALCGKIGCKYVVLPKTLGVEPISTSEIVRRVNRPLRIPLRVDFAGGWLDVPRFAQPDGFIVNAAVDWIIEPRFFDSIPCRPGSGLGGSAVWAILQGKEAFASELNNGVGWQDPAIVLETGLCVWKSGPKPELLLKSDGKWFNYHIGLFDTYIPHVTRCITEVTRDYVAIKKASRIARNSVLLQDSEGLCISVDMSYATQLSEGMNPLPYMGEEAKKYCGAGYGGYAMYLFKDEVPDIMKEVHIYTKGYNAN